MYCTSESVFQPTIEIQGRVYEPEHHLTNLLVELFHSQISKHKTVKYVKDLNKTFLFKWLKETFWFPGHVMPKKMYSSSPSHFVAVDELCV